MRRDEVKSRAAHDWADRMEQLAVHAPDLNSFSVELRDALGWEIAQDGRQFLSATAKAVAGQREALINHLFLASEVADAAKLLIPAQSPSEPAATLERQVQSTHGVTQQSPRPPPRLRSARGT
ncbi:hypothetical protein [Bradyrhizobium sp. ERR14]|uniref:hypothetical protein n=1 Tax=Bradyrhizobium sp. ERR14 TaxID=2663837 RepID=UPI001617FB1E|nr:hypothetical protein [Bradyrhizobium sp. ERR14]MBB4396545.1 hypothetical protein [Bradyrhizobium sp. ERR14]